MHLASPHAKVGRIGEDVDILLPSQQESILREANIIADSKSKSRKLSLERAQLGWSRLHVTRLVENDSVRDVDIKEMLLAMRTSDLARLVEAQARVVNALVTFYKFRDATTDDVSLSLASKLRKHPTRHTALI